MKIYLIRHGETTGDIEDRYGGDYDDHLTEKGKQQAQDLAQYLKNKNIEIIYHSPKIRARETTQIINHYLNLKLQEITDLRERNAYGILTGLIKSQAKQKYPEQVAELLRDKLYHKVKNSEDYDSFKKRVTIAFDKITHNQKYSTIAIVCHGGPISCIVRELLNLGEFKKLGDCAVLEIERNSKSYKLIKLTNAELER